MEENIIHVDPHAATGVAVTGEFHTARTKVGVERIAREVT
jgi:hypothetical protein